MKTVILYMIVMATFLIAFTSTMSGLARLEAQHKRRAPRTVMV